MSTHGIEIHRSENNNLTRVYLGTNLTIWFSYETPVAFAISGEGTFKSENIWSRTTGRHLNTIPAKVTLEHAEFTRRLNQMLDDLSATFESASISSEA